MRKQSFWKKCVCLLLVAVLTVGACVSLSSCSDGGYDDEKNWIGPY